MDKKEIRFIVTGKDAGGASEEIKKIIKEEYNFDIIITEEKDNHQSEQTKVVDPITLGALILALPGAILAVVDLASRIKNKKKLDKVLEKIEKQVVQKKKVVVKIQYPDGKIKEISTVDSVEILDMFTRKED